MRSNGSAPDPWPPRFDEWTSEDLEAFENEPRPGYPREERQRRLYEFLHGALASRDPLAANVGVMNADLMWLSDQLQGLIERWAPVSSAAEHDMEYLQALVKMLLEVQTQAGRLAVLGVRLEDRSGTRPASAAPPPAASEETAT